MSKLQFRIPYEMVHIEPNPSWDAYCGDHKFAASSVTFTPSGVTEKVEAIKIGTNVTASLTVRLDGVHWYRPEDELDRMAACLQRIKDTHD